MIDLHFRSRYAKHLSTSVKPSGSEWKSLDDTVMQWNQYVVIELLVMIRFFLLLLLLLLVVVVVGVVVIVFVVWGLVPQIIGTITTGCPHFVTHTR